jgi:hypothetical protein
MSALLCRQSRGVLLSNTSSCMRHLLPMQPPPSCNLSVTSSRRGLSSHTSVVGRAGASSSRRGIPQHCDELHGQPHGYVRTTEMFPNQSGKRSLGGVTLGQRRESARPRARGTRDRAHTRPRLPGERLSLFVSCRRARELRVEHLHELHHPELVHGVEFSVSDERMRGVGGEGGIRTHHDCLQSVTSTNHSAAVAMNASDAAAPCTLSHAGRVACGPSVGPPPR